MNPHNNPAARLAVVVDKGATISAGANITAGWAKILGVEERDIPLLVARYSKVVELPQQVRTELDATPFASSADALLNFMPQLERGLMYLNFHTGWSHISSSFDKTVQQGLASCAVILSRERPQPTLTKEQLDNIQAEIEQLFFFVRDAEIDDDLKAFILKHLQLIDEAIKIYWINGAHGVTGAIEKVIGTAWTQRSIWARLRETQAGRRFWTLISSLALLVGMASDIKQLTAPPTLPEITVVETVDDHHDPTIGELDQGKERE